MRRFVQVMTLVLAILAGALGGHGVAATPRSTCSCCGNTAAGLPGADGCRMPGRTPNPSNPCSMEVAPVTVALATPPQAIERPGLDGQAEPSPFPAALRLSFPAPSARASAQLGDRPDPARPFPTGHDPLALLSVFRI